MSGLENVAGSPEIDCILIGFARRTPERNDIFTVFQRATVTLEKGVQGDSSPPAGA